MMVPATSALDQPTAMPPKGTARSGSWVRRLVFGVVAGAVLLAGGLSAYVVSLPPLPWESAREVSQSVVDRQGKLLRAYAMKDGRWRLPVNAATDIDPRFVAMLLAYEDSRFAVHHGVDPRALMRAAYQLTTRGHIVSGGSTITMQLARLIEPRKTRSLHAKLRQIVRAVQIERSLSKDEILDLYLTLAPYGGNLEGIRAASLAYFGKEPKRLSLGEAALLVAIPQSPEARRPDRAPVMARSARDGVIARLVTAGALSSADAARAKREKVPEARQPMPLLAPHAADEARLRFPGQSVIRLTLDQRLQIDLEALVRERIALHGPDVSMALLAVDHASGEIRARVGSADFLDARRAGQVDMTRALRSPGSTLKPFIYGLAFEDGFAHPQSLIEDRPLRFGSYAPENFDMTFQGTVSVAHALQMSLNVPAVALLERVGAHRLAARLTQAGGHLVFPKDEAPGLAMGLGGLGVTLNDLVGLYTGLARQGESIALTQYPRMAGQDIQRRRLLDKIAAWQVGHVLIGTPPPTNGAAGRIAFKTGTSYGYRDAWSVGFDGRYTIGVWVGRADGAPVPGIVGRSAAAPVVFDAFARTGQIPAPLAKAPRGVLFASTAKLPLPLQRVRRAGEEIRLAKDVATPRIQFPQNGARLDVFGERKGEGDPVILKVAGGTLPLTILRDGVVVGEMKHRRESLIPAAGPGFMRLTVMDAAGQADSIVVRLQ